MKIEIFINKHNIPNDMKRKLIRQGGGKGLTVYLPKKWIDERHLGPGDEINIDELEDNLILSTAVKEEKSSVTLDIKGEHPMTIRTIIANAYRSGYDSIKVKFKNKEQRQIIEDVVSSNLLGFEVMGEKDDFLIIESVAEPSVEDFNAIFIKILQIVSVHLEFTIESLKSNSVDLAKNSDFASKTMRYDNFCRRAISKKRLTEKKSMFYWSFFATVVHVDRRIDKFNKDLSKTKPSKEVISFFTKARDMFNLLKESYLKKDMDMIYRIHTAQDSLLKEGILLLKKNSLLAYDILDIIRNTHLATSPLAGIIV